MSRATRVAIVVVTLVMAAGLSIAAFAIGNAAEAGFVVVSFLAGMTASAVGGMIIVRQPDNRIGWMFCVMGAALPAAVFADSYVYAAITHRLPFLAEAAWLAQWLYFVFIFPGVLLFAVFPSGRLSSWRLLPITFLAVTAWIVTMIGQAFGPKAFDISGRLVPNPYQAPMPLAAWLTVAAEIGNIVLIGSAIVFAIALVSRLHGAEGIERQQLKWFVAAAVFLALSIPSLFLLPDPWDEVGWAAVLAGFGAGLPLATGIAILRYRLYDIDLVIRRTLVYGALVAILGGSYVGLVLALQSVLGELTGGDTLPVALSTLAIATLFGPVRARVREVVDRRFYRSRYDAQRTVEAFAGRLRDEVELDAVGRSLVDVAGRAVQPTSASVWLRGGPAR